MPDPGVPGGYEPTETEGKEKDWGGWCENVTKLAEDRPIQEIAQMQELVDSAPNSELAKKFMHCLARSLELGFDNFDKDIMLFQEATEGRYDDGKNPELFNTLLEVLTKRYRLDTAEAPKDHDYYRHMGQFMMYVIARDGVMPEDFAAQLVEEQQEFLHGQGDATDTMTHAKGDSYIRQGYNAYLSMVYPEPEHIDSLRNSKYSGRGRDKYTNKFGPIYEPITDGDYRPAIAQIDVLKRSLSQMKSILDYQTLTPTDIRDGEFGHNRQQYINYYKEHSREFGLTPESPALFWLANLDSAALDRMRQRLEQRMTAANV